MKKLASIHLEEVIAVSVFALLPIIVLVHALIASKTWCDSLDAWRGRFTDPTTNTVSNPWVGILPLLASLVLIYVVFSLIATNSVRYIKPDSPVFRFRLVIGLSLTIIGTLALFGATFYASLVYLRFIDLRIGGVIPPNSLGLMVFISLIILTINIYRVITISR